MKATWNSTFQNPPARQHLAVPLGAGFAMCLGIDGRYYGQDLIIGKWRGVRRADAIVYLVDNPKTATRIVYF